MCGAKLNANQIFFDAKEVLIAAHPLEPKISLL